jgi:hypothetical protein
MLERLKTTEIIRRSEWAGLNEDMPYRPPKCKFTGEDWEKLYNSEVYNDLLSMGWDDITSDFRRKMGNLVFQHANFFIGSAFRINREGKILEVEIKSENQKTLITADEENYGRECATISDYIRKMDFIMKMTLNKMKVIKSEEVISQIGYKTLIRKKLAEDPTGVTRRRMEFVPASMADELR